MFRSVDLITRGENTIKWITDQYKKELIFVDNSFQRNYVWLKKHQVKLIETILLGYSIPEIYLSETKTDPETGDTIFSIVDGQQRIGAVVDFINNKYSLSSAYLDEESKEKNFANKKFSQLNDDEKSNIWGYRFFMRIMNKNVHRDDIVKTFLRLNATDKSLNPQELRNAEFNGLFLETATEIANHNFWTKYNFFSPNDLRRMRDVELVSSLLIFLRFGVEHEINQSNINKAYDLFNEKYDERKDDSANFYAILKEIEQVFNKEDLNKNFFGKRTHFYILFIFTFELLYLRNEKINEEILNLITEFVKAYEQIDTLNPFSKGKEEKINKYKILSQGGTSDKSNRMNRVNIFKNIILNQ